MVFKMRTEISRVRKRLIKRWALFFCVFITAAAAGGIIERFKGEPFTTEPMPAPSAAADAAPTEEPQVLNDKININTADAELLCMLDGIGEATAEKIIEYREQNGGFGVIEDIMNISGISRSKFERIKNVICTE